MNSSSSDLGTALLGSPKESAMRRDEAQEEEERIQRMHESVVAHQISLTKKHAAEAAVANSTTNNNTSSSPSSTASIQPISISKKKEKDYSPILPASPGMEKEDARTSGGGDDDDYMNSSLSKSASTHIDAAAGRIYASNAPKILLETITARTALLVIMLTYAVFFLGFALDFNTIYSSFNSNSYETGSYSCSSYNASYFWKEDVWGCSNQNRWNSTVSMLTNVISVKLSVQQNNLTVILNDDIVPYTTIIYDIELYACYNEDGCGNSYESGSGYTTDPNVWQKVLNLNNQNAHVDFENDIRYSQEDGYYISYELLQYTFQNQESIPTNGLVKSYHMSVVYVDDEFGLFSGVNANAQQYITYSFDVVDRPFQPIVDAMTIVLIFVTVGVLIVYVSVLRKQPYILPEQKWLVVYFILVIFFQNPIYVIIDWYKQSPPAGAAYASYVLNYLGQSGLFVLWLLFSDSINRKASNMYWFYLPKIFFGLLIFVTGIVILTIQFPGLNPTPGPKRNGVEAVVNWTHDLRIQFIVFTVMYLCLIFLWAILWIFRLFITGRALKRIPYMSTRYIQLSYRFFSIQATLVTFYYVFQYAAVLYYLSRGTQNSVYDTISITDSINTLFRQQTQLFGKTLFLTVYAAVLAFLFLPANFWESSANKTLTASLAATYVISEVEQELVVKKRKEALKKIKGNLLGQVTRFDQLIDAKSDVFCVDIAMMMRAASYNSYYDPPDVTTSSGFEGGMDLDAIGYELVDYIYERTHEVFGYIAREKSTGRLVVCFRGTASKKQMEDNLNYTKKPVDFSNLAIPTLDHIDGLTIKPLAPEDDFELESVSDDEEDLVIEDNNEELIFGGAYGTKVVSKGMIGRIDKNHHQSANDSRETMMEKAGHVTGGISKVLNGAVDVTNQGINKVVGATTGLVVTAASNTPGLKRLLLPHVHSGFWDAYLTVRGFIHAVLRQELVKNPTTVFFTGHSLGGALSTYAALDVALYTIPRVNAYLKHQAKLQMVWQRTDSAKGFDSDRKGLKHWMPMLGKSTSHSDSGSSNPNNSGSRNTEFARAPSLFGVHDNLFMRSKSEKVFVKRIKVAMYSFGSPRVGNTLFAQLYDKLVPNTFRVVVDGDVVVGLPPGYTHIGTEILIDSIGSGSIIIDPSFVEKWLRTHIKSSVAAHSLLVYRKSLLGLKLSAEYMKKFVENRTFDDVDPLKVAMRIRNNIEFTKLVEQHFDPMTVLDSNPFDLTRQMSRGSDHKLTSDDKMLLTEIRDEKKLSADPYTNSQLSPIAREHTSVGISAHSDMALQDVLNMEAKHYERDKEHMEELMKQIGESKKPGAIGWIKDHTVNKIQKSKSQKSLHDPEIVNKVIDED